MSPVTRQRLREAISVHWTPAVAARVKGRILRELDVRRRRRRAARVVVALLLIGGTSFAFPAARSIWRRQHLARGGALSSPSIAPEPTRATATAVPPAAAIGQPSPAREMTAAAAHEPAPVRRRRVVASAAGVETATSLLARADAARLAGRPRDAIAPLTAVFTRFPRDPRAPVAAFQLGRVLSDQLGDDAAAARAFDRARQLDPSGPLAADAARRAAEAGVRLRRVAP